MHNLCMTSFLRSLALWLLVAWVPAHGTAVAHAGAAAWQSRPSLAVDNSQTPAPATSSAPSPAPAAPVRLERFVDRVWVVGASTAIAVGSRYVFLSDNVLVVSVKDGTPVVGTWAEDLDGLVLTERGRSSKVEVLELTEERFRIRVNTPKKPTDITLVPAITPPAPPPPVATTAAAPAPAPVVAPLGSPFRCGGDTFRLAFEDDKAYLTWPDNTVAVLKEVKVADAPASRRTYSDGQLRIVEDTSESFTRVFFARPGFRPRPCSSAR
jgi:hypothetical protein